MSLTAPSGGNRRRGAHEWAPSPNHSSDEEAEEVPLRAKPQTDSTAIRISASGGPAPQALVLAHRQELAAQDAALDALHASVTRLGQLSANIGDELKQQDVMLDELESDVYRADNAVQRATRQTAALIKRTGGYRWFVGVAFSVETGITSPYLLVVSQA